jgi:hypothetical protein
MALTVAGPVGCKERWKEGRPPMGKYTLTACAIRSL